jgi:CBS domain-containing protein
MGDKTILSGGKMKAKVRDYFALVTPEADMVNIDTSIEEIIRVISRNPASRSVYVVDEAGRLIGMIGVREILNILGAKYLQKQSITLAHEILATTAGDLMRDVESVSPDDDFDQALRISVMHNMEDIPVVENDRVIGSLDCFELIKGIEDQHRMERGGRHGPD